jgi:hypothetical protein
MAGGWYDATLRLNVLRLGYSRAASAFLLNGGTSPKDPNDAQVHQDDLSAGLQKDICKEILYQEVYVWVRNEHHKERYGS